MREMYDIVLKKSIFILDKKLMSVSRELGLDYTAVSKLLHKEQFHVVGRYILPENKDKIFTLVNYDTGEEYDCITNKSLKHHFNQELTENEIKYVYELLSGRQYLASICDRALIKKGVIKDGNFVNIKASSIRYNKEREAQLYRCTTARDLRGRLANIIQAVINKRKNSAIKSLVGCTHNELAQHLSNRFTSQMTWGNYGEWVVDHIIPLSLFDLSNKEEVLRANHYTNLQPLWSSKNIAEKYGEFNYISNSEKNCKNILGGRI